MTYQQAFDRAIELKRPFRFDNDYICNNCGEPWDTHGIYDGDMTENEKKRFLLGLGCPSCPKSGEQR